MSDRDHLERIAISVCERHHFTLVAPVGSGAFKATFHVQDKDKKAQALKLYNHRNRTSRVHREIEAITRCSHPNIARFHTLATIDVDQKEHLYTLEEFIDGGTLEELLQRGKLSLGSAIRLGGQLVDAVGHIANLELVHRDIKPANIMLRRDSGDPVLVDFGLVRNLGASSLTETWIPQGPGTPYFSPPEQLNNDKELIDWRADQYTLGIVMAMAICGRHPYETGDRTDIRSDVVERVASRAEPASWFQEWTRETNMSVLMRMVQPWPVQRYRQPADLFEAWKTLG